MIMRLSISVLLLCGAVHLPGQVPAGADAELARSQKALGAKLNHLGRVDAGVYKGSKPRSDADYKFLQSLHVKYIVDLQVFPWVAAMERARAKRYGITVIPAQMNASPVSPSEKHIETILAMLRDSRCHPIYFHCALGRDRTSVIAALYKRYFLGMSREGTIRYLYESGYKDGWERSGLKRYLEEHPTAPPSLLSSRRGPGQCATR
jgi:protein tyrosine/serine phosphatase